MNTKIVIFLATIIIGSSFNAIYGQQKKPVTNTNQKTAKPGTAKPATTPKTTKPTTPSKASNPTATQKSSDENVLTYSLVRNDPTNGYRNLNISLVPFYMNLNNFNASFSGGFFASYILKNIVAVNIGYNVAYLDRFDNGVSETTSTGWAEGVPVGGSKAARNFELTGKVFFSKKIKKKTESVWVKSGSDGMTYIRTRSKVFTRIEADRLYLWGVRGGIMSASSQFNDKRFRFQGAGVDSTNQVKELANDNTAMVKTQMLTIGLCRYAISDLLVNIDKYGNRKKMDTDEWYFDMLIATGFSFSNISYPISRDDQTGIYTYKNIDVNETPTSAIGFRAGWNTTSTGWLIQYMYGFECGIMPSPQVGNIDARLFFVLRAGMTFNVKL